MSEAITETRYYVIKKGCNISAEIPFYVTAKTAFAVKRRFQKHSIGIEFKVIKRVTKDTVLDEE